MRRCVPPVGALRSWPKLGSAQALHEDLAPAASTTCECSAIRRRIWSREHRASCGERMRCPSGPRACLSASSATLRCARLACAAFKRSGPLVRALGKATFLGHPKGVSRREPQCCQEGSEMSLILAF
eukprot:scaffold142738_cov136-Phaeocystis_antarctica.AAC.2